MVDTNTSDSDLAKRSTYLFTRPIPFLGPSDGCNLLTISAITLLEKADCQNDREWQNEVDK
jgi:hypothetical protein